MANVSQILVAVNITLMMIGGSLALIYLLTIILVRRFHTAGNILTGNVCLVSIMCTGFWCTLNVIGTFYPTLMMQYIVLNIFSSYSEIMFNCFLVYSIVVVTINRFLSIKYQNKIFFKKLIWSIISSIVEWIVSIILPIPLLILCYEVSLNSK
jgi:hypothetical protein